MNYFWWRQPEIKLLTFENSVDSDGMSHLSGIYIACHLVLWYFFCQTSPFEVTPCRSIFDDIFVYSCFIPLSFNYDFQFPFCKQQIIYFIIYFIFCICYKSFATVYLFVQCEYGRNACFYLTSLFINWALSREMYLIGYLDKEGPNQPARKRRLIWAVLVFSEEYWVDHVSERQRPWFDCTDALADLAPSCSQMSLQIFIFSNPISLLAIQIGPRQTKKKVPSSMRKMCVFISSRLHMRRVSSGHMLSIKTFCSINNSVSGQPRPTLIWALAARVYALARGIDQLVAKENRYTG